MVVLELANVLDPYGHVEGPVSMKHERIRVLLLEYDVEDLVVSM